VIIELLPVSTRAGRHLNNASVNRFCRDRAVLFAVPVSGAAGGLPVGGNVPSLADSLSQVMTIQGARAAALIDIATGMIVASAGQLAGDFPAAAADMAGEAQTARVLAGLGQDGGDLEESSLVAAGRLHVSRVLGAQAGDGLLLFPGLDRARANMALASLRISQIAPQVLA
jgi:hypothetical protein